MGAWAARKDLRGLLKPELTFSEGIAGKTWIPVAGCNDRTSSVTLGPPPGQLSDESIARMLGIVERFEAQAEPEAGQAKPEPEPEPEPETAAVSYTHLTLPTIYSV